MHSSSIVLYVCCLEILVQGNYVSVCCDNGYGTKRGLRPLSHTCTAGGWVVKLSHQ